MSEPKIVAVTLYFPNGESAWFDGADVLGVGNFPTGERFVDIKQGENRRRYIGLPCSIELAPPSAIVPATLVPPLQRS